MGYTLTQVAYEADSDIPLVKATLTAKKGAQSTPGIGPYSCWAGVAVPYTRNGYKYSIRCSQSRNEIWGPSPYKNQWVKYHGEISAIAQVISAYWEESGTDVKAAAVYIELSPCENCSEALTNLLPDKTTVYYSFPYTKNGVADWEAAAKKLCQAN